MIGIIAAEEKEMQAIKNIMTDVKENDVYNLKFFEGKIGEKSAVLVRCGVRKSKL